MYLALLVFGWVSDCYIPGDRSVGYQISELLYLPGYYPEAVRLEGLRLLKYYKPPE